MAKEDQKKILKEFGLKITSQIDKGRNPEITFPLRNLSNIIYDKKTRICTSCGKLTKSGKGSGGIGLNAEATKYLEDCVARLGKHYTKFNQHKFSDKFVLVGLFFIRPTDAGFDYDNMETMIGDALQKSTLIINDRAKMFMMIPMGYILDNVNPGVIISIIDHKKYFKFLISNYVS